MCPVNFYKKKTLMTLNFWMVVNVWDMLRPQTEFVICMNWFYIIIVLQLNLFFSVLYLDRQCNSPHSSARCVSYSKSTSWIPNLGYRWHWFSRVWITVPPCWSVCPAGKHSHSSPTTINSTSDCKTGDYNLLFTRL